MSDVRRPKLLLLVTSSAWGGAERYVIRLASAASAEFDVTVAAGPSKSRELFRRLPPGVKAFELADLVRPIAPWRDLKAIRRLRTLIDQEGFDFLHANSSKAGLVGALAARLSRARPRVLFTAHGWGFSERRSLPFRLAVLWSEKLAARFRAATIVLTAAERGIALKERLSTPERLHLIPLGIDREEIDFLDAEAAHAELARICAKPLGRPVIGTIANAYPAKDLPMLLKAFERLATENPDAELVVLGDGPEMPRLLALRASLSNRKRIHLPGAIPDAARLLKGFGVFALSSSKEGLPWVILEASLAGVHIVATKVGALPELIEKGLDGWLVPPGDDEAMANALAASLTNLPQQLKSGAPRIAERRSGLPAEASAKAGSDMVASTLDLYRSLTRSVTSDGHVARDRKN